MGIIWKQSLLVTPITRISSDRFCVVQLQRENLGDMVYIIGVYLPSCDHSMDEFMDYLHDLENAISTLQPTGTVIMAGDLNAHLTQLNHHSSYYNSHESLLQSCIHQHSLYVVSTGNAVLGPAADYTSQAIPAQQLITSLLNLLWGARWHFVRCISIIFSISPITSPSL